MRPSCPRCLGGISPAATHSKIPSHRAQMESPRSSIMRIAFCAMTFRLSLLIDAAPTSALTLPFRVRL